jgi:hypothetical protein
MASLPIAPAPTEESRGVSVWLLRWLVLKELVDNALDEMDPIGEATGVAG